MCLAIGSPLSVLILINRISRENSTTKTYQNMSDFLFGIPDVCIKTSMALESKELEYHWKPEIFNSSFISNMAIFLGIEILRAHSMLLTFYEQ